MATALAPMGDPVPDPALVAQGWQRRFMADPQRLKEARALYQELGHEVLVVAVEPEELSVACGDCRVAVCHIYATIYTRKLVGR
jgi:hypothetical protein